MLKASNQDSIASQLLSKEVVEYIRNRKPNQNRGVDFSFWYKPDDVDPSGEKNKAYAEIVYKVGGVWQTPVTGDTVKPDDKTKWWHGLVYASLPTNTEAVKVRIVGNPYSGAGFKARIDLALLSVYYSMTKPDTQGNATLTANIYYSNTIPQSEWDGFVSLATSVTAEAKDGYSVVKVMDLKVELLPNNQSATTQDGRLIILSAGQTNNRNFDLDPEAQEGGINTVLQNIETSIGIGVSAASFVVGLGTIGSQALSMKILKVGLSGTGVAWSFYRIFSSRVNLYNPLAEGGTSYAVWETFDYTGALSTLEDRFGWTSCSYHFDWRFRTDSDDIFAIKISATVEWRRWDIGDPNDPYDDRWVSAGQTPLSTIVSIADYWQ